MVPGLVTAFGRGYSNKPLVHLKTITVVCRTPVRFFLRGIEKPSGLYILRNSGNQSEISHHYRKAPESTDSVMIMAVSLAGCCMPLCTPLPLLILVLHAGEADFGINGIFWIGCWNYAIYITPSVSLCPLKKTGQVFCKQLYFQPTLAYAFQVINNHLLRTSSTSVYLWLSRSPLVRY